MKKEIGSDTPKWVFHHPEISDAGSNRVHEIINVDKEDRRTWGKGEGQCQPNV